MELVVKYHHFMIIFRLNLIINMTSKDWQWECNPTIDMNIDIIGQHELNRQQNTDNLPCIL